MSEPTVTIVVPSQTAPTGSNTVVVFDTTVQFPGGGGISIHRINRITCAFAQSHSSTLKAYSRATIGGTWDQVGGDIALSATTTDLNRKDFLVDDLGVDFKLEWTNGGTTQTTYRARVSLISGDRASGT